MLLVFKECTITSIHLVSERKGRCRQTHQVGHLVPEILTSAMPVGQVSRVRKPCAAFQLSRRHLSNIYLDSACLSHVSSAPV